MIKKRLYIFLTIILAGILSINAQTVKHTDSEKTILHDSLQTENPLSRQTSSDVDFTPQLPQIVLPSPTSQMYSRFMGYQPNLSTGAVNVTIPIHTLNVGQLSLPFNLNYQSNGIKPTDPYYPLGYGWTLQPGLRITRCIMGFPDDQKHDRDIEMHAPEGWNPSADCYFNRLSQQVSGYEEDYMYDIFTICLPSGNASFILEYLGNSTGEDKWKAVTVDTPWTIEVLQENKSVVRKIYGFKVTDENGTIYFFGNESEIGTKPYPYLEMSEDNMPTTYLLRKIMPSGKQEIDFKWQIYDMGTFSTATYEKKIDDLHLSCPEYMTEKDETDYVQDRSYTLANSTLKSISCNSFKMDFFYYPDYKILKSIIIQNAENRIVKSVVFDMNDKLLQKVTINNEETYSFTYNEGNFERTFICEDLWGYYNGQLKNQTNYPTLVYLDPQGNNKTHTISGADKSPNPSCMGINLLKSITYPTGGTTTFEYEPNRIQSFDCGGTGNNIIPCIGGGMRVRKMTSSSGSGDNHTIVKTYKYGYKGNGYGKGTIYPCAESYAKEEHVYWMDLGSGCYYCYRRLTMLPHSQYEGYFTFNLPMWYDEVAEYSSEGKTVYKYQYEADYMERIGSNTYEFSPQFSTVIKYFPTFCIRNYNNIFQKSPLLSEKIVYDINEKVVSSVKNTYMLIEEPQKYLTALFFSKIATNMNYKTCDIKDFSNYDWTKTYINLRKYKLFFTEIMENNVKYTKKYTYHNKHSYNIASITTWGEDNTVIKEKFTYPGDNLSNFGDEQTTNVGLILGQNRLTLPLRVECFIDDSLTVRKTIQYKVLPQVTGHNPYIVPEKEYFGTENQQEECRITYSYHNADGKISTSAIDGESTVYIWGYCGMYPLAVIKNATYEEVTNILGENFLEKVMEKSAPDVIDIEQINTLRTSLTNAMVTSYTYQPLTGILSETNPAGLSVYYTYDSSDRLIEKYRMATDTTGTQVKELIESYTYTYKKQL